MHAQGLVHRDLKPENIFLADDGQGRVVPKILDFGIVKPFTHTQGHWTATQDGVVVGTPAYMAPEQWTGRPVDARADLYALSAVLYELLTLRHPLRGASGQLTRGLAGHLLVPPSRYRPELSAALDDVVMRGLSVLPDERYQTAVELRDALRAAVRARPEAPRMRGRLPAVLGVAALVGLVSGGLLATRRGEHVQALPPPLPERVIVEAASVSPEVVETTVSPVIAETTPVRPARRKAAVASAADSELAPDSKGEPDSQLEPDVQAEVKDTTLLDLLGIDEAEAQRILKQAGPTTSAQLAHAVEQLGKLDAPGAGESR